MSEQKFLTKFGSLLDFFQRPVRQEVVVYSPPLSPAEMRGEESEETVFRIINDMMVWKELPTRKKGACPYRTPKWSDLDRRGVDIVVPTKRGDIYIQVKSSSFWWSRFVLDQRNWQVICINGQHDKIAILKELRNKLRIAYERLSDHT